MQEIVIMNAEAFVMSVTVTAVTKIFRSLDT